MLPLHFSKTSPKCGEVKSKDGKNFGSSLGLSGLVRLSECNDEVKHHLISCHLSKEVLSENELILARTGLFHLAQEDKQKMWICHSHHHTLGKFAFLHSVNQKFQ